MSSSLKTRSVFGSANPILSSGIRAVNRVPICSKYCDDWFEACKDDMTCAQDWLNGFNFTSNVYSCLTSSTCRTFSEVTLVKLTNQV